jgi:hypothetical protein
LNDAEALKNEALVSGPVGSIRRIALFCLDGRHSGNYQIIIPMQRWPRLRAQKSQDLAQKLFVLPKKSDFLGKAPSGAKQAAEEGLFQSK